MKLVAVDKTTEDIFLCCFHPRAFADDRIVKLRYNWYEKNIKNGLRAKILINDEGIAIGLCQYIPIEYTHFTGNNLFVILCIGIHEKHPELGNQQKKGYGRYIMECIEKDAKESGADGVAAWGMDFPQFLPVSFYEHMGYAFADQYDHSVLVWKVFPNKEVVPPKIRRYNYRQEKQPGKISMTVLLHGWCNWGCETCIAARDAAKDMEDRVNYVEIDTSYRENMDRYGIDDALVIDGSVYVKDYPPRSSDSIRNELLDDLKIIRDEING